jgi:type VI secretion system secreted protein VgrG
LGTYTQDNRLIQILTPLDKDVLLLQSFHGQEGISNPFQFELKMHSENRSIAFDSIVGKKTTIKLELADKSVRHINGIISSFSQGGASTTFAFYYATLVPWLWFLTRTSDCRIFQNISVPDIIQKIFQEYGFSDFKNKLHGSYAPREYCVQYRETDFNFVSRLMQEEGIYYFFEHKADKHTLVFADYPTEFKPCPDQPAARYESAENVGRTEEVVTDWGIGQEVRPGKYSVKDFDFEKPSLNLLSMVSGKDTRKYEIYDYPGEYKNLDEGERIAGMRIQEEETPQIVVNGASRCRGFLSGHRFRLKDHYRRDLNKEYVLTSIYHTCEAGTNYRSSDTEAANDFEYVNKFLCTPYPSPFRPPRTAPVPVVHGTQTAIVVGPPGEEIYVDKYGRVKVQFHWDREGKYNEKSSCWIRVSHPWAGKGWGAISIPRIGQEVVVDFLEGDPDRPIITGRVYNAEQRVPYGLPGDKTRSTMKSNSSKGGGGYNEIRLEDKKGSEQMFIHAQKDMDMRVKHDKMETVENDSHLTVTKNKADLVGGSNSLSVKGEHKQYCDSKFSLKVKGNVFEEFLSSHKLAVTNEHLLQAAKVILQAGQEFTIQGPGCFIKLDPTGITIQGVMVRINSGGMPGMSSISGKGSDPDKPKDAEGS